MFKKTKPFSLTMRWACPGRTKWICPGRNESAPPGVSCRPSPSNTGKKGYSDYEGVDINTSVFDTEIIPTQREILHRTLH